ncbi:MAG: L-2-amino-thiazoline-4-carboxylic acid hydrolase [Spirochaetes bacterium]|nr:L-2-amino-thiazoline-4-carboxylic acid hydrolase [Spirochaetota bacterium]
MKAHQSVAPDPKGAIPTERTITRRAFCRISALSLLALSPLTGCARTESHGDPGTYYLSRQSTFLETLDSFSPHMESLLLPHYGGRFGESVIRETRAEFRGLLTGIPFIGGDENGLTEDLVQAAMVLSFYRVMRRRRRPLDEVGRLVFEAYERLLGEYPGFLFRLGWSWSGRRNNREAAAVSQQRRFPGDWVSRYVEGSGNDCDWGIDHLECGIVKYLRQQEAPELTPYCCLMDLPTFSKAGAGLTRMMTIASGSDHCDFRFKSGAPTRLLDPWSVATLERWGKLPR